MHTRHQHQVRALGPRALAIISCALALLAAQPAVAGTSHDTVVALRISGSDFQGAPLPAATRSTTNSAPSVIRQPIAQTSARRRHVLATVEILKRLLAFELRPVERPRFFGIAPLSPPQLSLFESLVPPRYPIGLLDPPRISAERHFVMARCLLAPPTA